MSSTSRTGRIVGFLLLSQLGLGLTLPFILTGSLIAGSPGFLTAAAEGSSQIRAAVFVAFVGGALTVAIGCIAFPVLRTHSEATARFFLSVCVLSCALDFVHNSTVMSMLSLSREYVSQGAADPGRFEVVGVAVAAARRWAHASQLVAIGMWIFVFHGSLLRFALIPRALAAVGVIGILLQFSGVTLMMLLGRRIVGELAMPMLPIQIAVAGWLMVKGFADRPSGSSPRPGGSTI